MKMTITEALAELKTLVKRIEKKRESITGFLWRQERFKDPLEKEGGSRSFIDKERQAVRDLEGRIIAIRRAIQKANDETSVVIHDHTRSISEWLTWRREVAPGLKDFLGRMRSSIAQVRREAQQKGLNVQTKTEAGAADTDIIININEQELATEIEAMEEILGTLDGQLSLKNATVMVDV